MPNPRTLRLGPLLGYEQGGYYTVCALTDPLVAAPPVLELSTGARLPFALLAQTPTGNFWRAEVAIAPLAAPQILGYAIRAADDATLTDRAGAAAWSFYVPAIGERARLAYAACNGFSSADLARDTGQPYALWTRLARLHAQEPFSLLLMGGDQLYADSVLELKGVKEWAEKSHDEMADYQPPPLLLARLDAFYDRLYQERWADRNMAAMLASIPSVMMWDDHDIIDGWGSHDGLPQGTPMYAAIFAAAKKYFELHQLRGAVNRSFLTPDFPPRKHCALAFDFADFRILAMDHRSERSVNQVMSDGQHVAVKAWLAAQAADANKPVLALSAIPVVYRSLARAETAVEFTPWTDEATDDVRDHWMASHHRGERTRLIRNLLACPAQVWLLSGDVHVGALGIIREKATDKASAKIIPQIVSTGIVHPPPGYFAWIGLRMLSSDDPETIPGTDITTEMLTPNRGERYLRDRNFATLRRDEKGKLWVNWICESEPDERRSPEFVM